MAKAPRPGAARKAEGKVEPADRGRRLVFEVDGEVHRVWLDRLSALDVKACRESTGRSVSELLRLPFDVDVLAAFLWLEARQIGQPEPFPVIAGRVTFGTPHRALTSDPDDKDEEEPGDPEG